MDDELKAHFRKVFDYWQPEEEHYEDGMTWDEDDNPIPDTDHIWTSMKAIQDWFEQCD